MQKGISSILIVVGLAIIVLVGGGLFYVGRSTTPKVETQQVQSAPSSTTKPDLQPSPSVQATAQKDETASWKTYTNSTYKYSFKYPSNRVVPGVDNSEQSIAESVILEYPPNTPGVFYPDFYVDVLMGNNSLPTTYNYDGFMKNLKQYLTTNIGQTVSPPDEPFNFTFTRKDDTKVDGMVGYVFVSSSGEKRVVIQKDNYLYVIGGYGDTTGHNSNFDAELATFKFLN